MALETRQALPYVSHLKITKRKSRNLVPVGQNQAGQVVSQWQENQPSISVEMTHYVGQEKTIAQPFTFYSRNFIQGLIDNLATLPDLPEVKAASDKLQARLNTEKLWLEDVLTAAEIPDLETMWDGAFSTALDEFPQWKEPEEPIGGIGNYFRQLEWDARLPLDSNKSVKITMGVYSTSACTEDAPERKELLFEDGQTKRNREAQIVRLQELVADRTATIGVVAEIKTWIAKPLSAERTAKLATYNQDIVSKPDLDAYAKQLQQELDGYSAQLASLNAIKYGAIANLLASPSIGGSIKSLVIALCKVLKANVEEWKDLDLDLVASRFFVPQVD
jgi:hypothetical protein